MTSFLEIVRLGIHAKNNNERKESEGQLLKMRKNHPNEFFKECGKNFNDDGLDDMTRKTISIIMNKSLKEKVNPASNFSRKTESRSGTLCALILKRASKTPACIYC